MRLRLLLVLACLAVAARAQDPPPSPEPDEGVIQDPTGDPAQDPAGDPPEEPAADETKPAAPPADLAERAGADPEPNPIEAATWPQRIARDVRLSFTLRSAAAASAALDEAQVLAVRRAAAWIALAYSGTASDRARIFKQARLGKGLERRGAILATGECGEDQTAMLTTISAEDDPATSECALLALLRSRRPEARERVEAIARDRDHPRSSVAASLLAFDRDPSGRLPPRAARTLIELRWEAARAFGGVDGAGYAMGRIAQLAASPVVVSEVVLRAASRLPGTAVEDHLLWVLVEGSGTGRLVAAVDAFPRQLSQLVHSGLWSPGGVEEWAVLLTEIERARAEALVPELLARAEEVPKLRWRARELLARADLLDIEVFTSDELAALEPADRELACHALGSATDPAARVLLASWSQDPESRVRSAALVARARLGDSGASQALDRILSSRSHADHAAIVDSLCHNAREISVQVLLEEYLKVAVGNDLVAVAEALTRQNRAGGRETVRSMLALDLPPTGERRLRLVRALAHRPTEKDIEILSQLFPQPGEDALNVELAVALASNGAPVARPIVISALWRGGFDEGVLAGALLADAAGLLGLLEELDRPPAQASDSDLRRVGFALGEWGGIEALEVLKRRSGSVAGPALQGALLGALGARTQ